MRRRWAALALLACAPLFLLDLSRLPNVFLLYALGHLFWFGLLTAALLQWPPLRRQTFARQALIILPAAALLGAGIELLQPHFGRSASLHDVILNLLGSLAALVFFGRPPASGRRLLRGAMVLALLAGLAPALSSALDDWRAYRDFPVLGDFRHKTEHHRWSRGEIQSDIVREGRYALRVPLYTTAYSGTTLQRNLGDWRGYEGFAFSAYNPGPDPLTITVSIRDRAHFARGTLYADRFNQRFELAPGWQDIVIPMAQIRTAPAQRDMELDAIEEVLFFATRLSAPRVLYLDRVRLLGH